MSRAQAAMAGFTALRAGHYLTSLGLVPILAAHWLLRGIIGKIFVFLYHSLDRIRGHRTRRSDCPWPDQHIAIQVLNGARETHFVLCDAFLWGAWANQHSVRI